MLGWQAQPVEDAVPLKRIMLIRHAEKPAEGISGVDLAGRTDDDSLSPLGWQRAGALVRFFFPPTEPNASPLSIPDAIFATGIGPGSTSKRSVQTASPLAKLLGQSRSVPFITKYLRNDIDDLVEDVRTREGCVLIVWEHKALASIVEKLTSGAHRPSEWSDDCFDSVWIVDAVDWGWAFSELSQDLLPGDSPTGSDLGCI